MTLDTATVDYGAPLATPDSYGFVGGWPEGEQSPEPTDTNSYSTKLFCLQADVDTAGKLSVKKIVSLADHVLKTELLAHLRKLQLTPEEERWPNADWPSDSAFRDAEDFIRKLPLASLPLPRIVLADDGEINFLWGDSGVQVDLGFYGTNTYSYFARARDGQKYYGEAIPASSGLPPEVAALFAA